MSDKAAAAQKWAEARDVLEAAANSLEQAAAAHNIAQTAEREAWVALEALAGRTAPGLHAAVPPGVIEKVHADERGEVRWPDTRRHDLPIRPLG